MSHPFIEMRRVKFIVALASGAAISLSGLALSAGSASAASQSTATCTTSIIREAQSSGIGIKVPASAAKSPNCLLSAQQYGSTATKVLQTVLNKCYGASLTVDGVFGSNTTAALKSAQRTIGVTADGIYGVKTHNNIKFWSEPNDGGRYCQYDSEDI